MTEFARSRGGLLVSKHGRDPLQHRHRVRFQCEAGHEWEAYAGAVMQYHTWCKQCFAAKRRKPPDDLHTVARSRGGTLLVEGRNRNTPATWQCSNGHTFQASPHNVLRGNWCPECSASRSERIVRTHFEQIFDKPFPKAKPKWLRNSTGHLLELDGYCPQLKLAFEHQGAQHYRSVGRFRRVSVAGIQQRDAVKRSLCDSRGITLIEIPELIRYTPLHDLRRAIVERCLVAGVELPVDASTKHIDISAMYVTTQDDESLKKLQSIAASRGGRCLADAYAGSDARVAFACARGHEWMARPADIHQGTWCKRCATKAVNDSKRLTIEAMQQIAREHGGECLSATYADAKTKLRWRCGQCGHEWDATPSVVRNKGQWCPPCGYRAGWNRRRAKYGPNGGNVSRPVTTARRRKSRRAATR
jgi:hypothetical protein